VVGVGDVIADKYRVERLLGRGTRGYVVAARHDRLDQQVAIKVLVPEPSEGEDSVVRFLREARASVPFQNEHVARVLDVGTLDSGAPYMVMEFLDGRDLARELDERVTLPTSEAVDYVLQACEALAEAHTLGMVHRHLKTANLFRTRRPDGSALIKVLGFGISEAQPTCGAADPSPLHLAATEGSASSPYYGAPEELGGSEGADPRADIWSLGIILFELLNGYPPRVSESSPSPILPTGKLQEIIRKCLERGPADRYANVIELANALQSYTPSGAAAVARIFAIVRSTKARSAGGAGVIAADTTLESPRMQVEIPSAEEWRAPPRTAVRSRWVAVVTGAGIAIGVLLVKTYVARAPTASRPLPDAVAQPARGQDAGVKLAEPAPAKSDPLRSLVEESRRPAAKKSAARPPPESAPPFKRSAPDAPPAEGALDPLEGRF
jgi:serine/threonine-protein kinase